MEQSEAHPVICPVCHEEVVRLLTPLGTPGASSQRVIVDPCGCELDWSTAAVTQQAIHEQTPLPVTLRPYLPGEEALLKQQRKRKSQ